jgi:hypothetical protein
MFLFLLSLFNDAFSSSDNVTSSDKTSEQIIGRDMKGLGRGVI